MFGWYIFVVKVTLGGSKGYRWERCMSRLNFPPSYGDPSGPVISVSV